MAADGEAQGQATAPAAQPPAAATPAPDVQSAKFSEGYNTGRDKAERDFNAEITKRFGVASLDDLQKQVEATRKNAPDVTQVESLTKQITELSSRHDSERLLWKVQSAMVGLDPHDPALTAQNILKEYEIAVDPTGRETIHKRGSKEIVVLDGKAASMRDLVQSLTRDPAFSWQFRNGASTSGVQAGQKTSKLKDDMLRDPAFVQALRNAGEYSNFINGKAVNEDAVLALYKKN